MISVSLKVTDVEHQATPVCYYIYSLEKYAGTGLILKLDYYTFVFFLFVLSNRGFSNILDINSQIFDLQFFSFCWLSLYFIVFWFLFTYFTLNIFTCCQYFQCHGHSLLRSIRIKLPPVFSSIRLVLWGFVFKYLICVGGLSMEWNHGLMLLFSVHISTFSSNTHFIVSVFLLGGSSWLTRNDCIS